VPAIEDGFSQNQIETPWRLLAQSGGRHAAPSRQQLGLDRTFPEFSADIAFSNVPEYFRSRAVSFGFAINIR
jgi:hypothetical protein